MTLEERGYIADAIKDVIEFNVKKEREACIEIVKRICLEDGYAMSGGVWEAIAAAIRERGEKK